MSPDHEHSPDEHGVADLRQLRPYTPPRQLQALSRRRFLRGSGVLMALPFLDSLPAWASEPASAGESKSPPATKYPQRFAAIFVGNGINSKHWWAKGTGADMELGK